MTNTGYERDRQGVFIRKDTASDLDYTVNWSEWLPEDDEIESTSFEVESIEGDAAPLVKGSVLFTPSACTVYLSGGSKNKVYTVSNTITTLRGLTERRQFRVMVEHKDAVRGL